MDFTVEVPLRGPAEEHRFTVVLAAYAESACNPDDPEADFVMVHTELEETGMRKVVIFQEPTHATAFEALWRDAAA